jgi:hypothetical protein
MMITNQPLPSSASANDSREGLVLCHWQLGARPCPRRFQRQGRGFDPDR